MKTKRLTMDIDFHDLTGVPGGHSQSDLVRLFDKMAEAGFDAAIWDHFFTGAACYHSKRFPVFSNAQRWGYSRTLADILKKWDPLAHAIGLGKERHIQVLAYFRLLEEAYAPFDGHAFFRQNPEYWWQTRCGMYRMVGWPMYNYPEVRAHMMERVRDLVEHGVSGALFDMARSHVGYFNAYRFRDGIGFNRPVVEEFKRRYGVDLAQFDYVEEAASADHGGLPFVYEHRWVGAAPYDQGALRRLLGEGFGEFLRDVRRRYPDFYIAVQAGPLEAGGRSDETYSPNDIPLFRIDLEGLCADRVINEYSCALNYRHVPECLGCNGLDLAESLNKALLPRFRHVQDRGVQLTAWLNDIFTPSGGGDQRSSVAEVTAYLDAFLASDVDGAFIHEAAFLLQCAQPEEMWKQLARLTR